MKINIKSFLDFVSRIAISSIFISAIPGKIIEFDKVVEYISSKGIAYPVSVILLIGAIVCLILGTGFFIFGRNQKLGALFLLLFLVPTTLIFHTFPFHKRSVLVNIGLAGGISITALRKPLKK